MFSVACLVLLVGTDPDLSDYRTVATAKTTKIQPSARPDLIISQPAYCGIHTDSQSERVVVIGLDAGSPADKAGLKRGDIITTVQGQAIKNTEGLRDAVQSHSPGEEIAFEILRDNQAQTVKITLATPSRPLKPIEPGVRRAVLGVQLVTEDNTVRVDAVTPNSPAAKGGIKVGDVILRIDDQPIDKRDRITEALAMKAPGDLVALIIQRAGREEKLSLKLPEDAGLIEPPAGWDSRLPRVFRKPVYQLAVIPIEYPDVKMNPKIKAEDWADSIFSTNTYIYRSATGQPVYGSVNDFYIDQSCGKFRLEGKVFTPVEVGKKRNDYTTTAIRYQLLTEALDALTKRDGDKVLDKFDGIFFIHAGDRVPTNRGGIYWPHRSSVRHKGRNYSYFICPEGGARMNSISVITHEFGHMLGLPDLYARPENPGSEGVGIWCTMSNGEGRSGCPFNLSAWCREQLGWLQPTVIDPSVKQKLILSPSAGSEKECFKVLIRPDGSEHLLLEHRVARGWDKDLPGEGLLIWRIVDGRPILEESHGVTGPAGPRVYLGAVPYPSLANNAFTPMTTPSSRSQKGGGKAVHITNIRKLPDGRIAFHIGYEYF